jgi:hypothetical protein
MFNEPIAAPPSHRATVATAIDRAAQARQECATSTEATTHRAGPYLAGWRCPKAPSSMSQTPRSDRFRNRRERCSTCRRPQPEPRRRHHWAGAHARDARHVSRQRPRTRARNTPRPQPMRAEAVPRQAGERSPSDASFDSSGAPSSPGIAKCRVRGRPATRCSRASAATRRRGGPRRAFVQTSSCTRLAMLGRARGNCSRTALRSLMPSTKPTCSSSAPRSYRRATTVRRIDSGVAHSSSA